MPPLFHVMTPEGWDRLQADGESRQSTRDLTLEEEGFIHCSYADQLEGTLGRFYADLPEVVVITLDPEVLEAEVREEGGFPHVFGPLSLDAVTDVDRRAPG
jgi:glutathione S-transferase